MSYKNDSYLVISNKFGSASSDAKAQLFETYDRLRDITVSGSALDGAGFGTAGGFLWQLARLIAPSSFMTAMGGSTAMNIAGTSYWTPMQGGNATVDGGNSAFGIGSIGNYPGFPSGAAPISWSFGSSSSDGYATGGASALTAASSIGGMAGVNAAAYGAGLTAGVGAAPNWVLPTAGVISGWGGILQAMSPYMGTFGLGATIAGNLLQGTSSAALSAYQKVTSNVLSNADVILTNKVKNIETVVKMLDTQGDIVKKMLKESIEADSKSVQNLS
ncbi:MAG: hypothetical protein PHV37_02295 [Candidatus Gastranaerophilales bacterium]|nr:hypothetical protein [Candidatus Gastranaerophilales bacterium]